MIWLVRLMTFVLFLTISGAVGLAFLFERASRGPLDAQFLTPWIERNASAQLAGGAVRVGATRIALQPAQQGAFLLLSDVQATGGASANRSTWPKLPCNSLPDALLGRLRITRLDIDGFRLAVRRDTSGRIGYSITPAATQPGLSAADAVPGWGDVAEASSALPAGGGEMASGQLALNRLRESLTDGDGLLSLFQEVRIGGAELIFDDAVTDQRVVVHDATLSFGTDRRAVEVSVAGLFEAGSSFSDGTLTVTTPLDPGADVALALALTDFALADAAAYLPSTLHADERTQGVDLRLEASLQSNGRLARFEAQQFPQGALGEARATFQPEPEMSVSGRRRIGGAGGWTLDLQAPVIDFASEPVFREYLSETFSFAGDVGGSVKMEVAEDGRLLRLDFATLIAPGALTIPDLYTQPVALDAGRFEGSLTPEGLSFSRFELAPVINGRALPMRGFDFDLQRGPEEQQAIRLGFDNDWPLRPADILALWPDVGDDAGRQVCGQHRRRTDPAAGVEPVPDHAGQERPGR